MKKYIIITGLVIGSLLAFWSCEDETTYDITWPVPEITEVSSFSAQLSETITLKGNFEEVTRVSFGSVKGVNMEVADDNQSLTVEVPRDMNIQGAPIIVQNGYEQSFKTDELFVPVIPETTIDKVSDVQVDLSFTVEGQNVDLLTEIMVDGQEASISSASPDKATIDVAGVDLNVGSMVDISFKSLAKNEIPDAEKVDVVYPKITYEEIVLWDFSDGTHDYEGEGTATVETGNVLGEEQNYFSLRAPGYGWDQATGTMTYEEVPDVSSLQEPHLTFAIRTPAGSAGYFQMEDANSSTWRHFGYGFDTGGEWVIISEPLDASWEGDGFNAGSWIPFIGFKAGNAGDNQDLDIAYVKITEGEYDGSQEIGDVVGGSAKPSALNIMNFEETSEWPDLYNGETVIGSVDFRKDDIDAFVGDECFALKGDESGGAWGACWGFSVGRVVSDVNFNAYDDPYLSFALNTTDADQYIIVRFFQYDGDLEMVQKFFPNTNGSWETFQFSLFNTKMENWSGGEFLSSLKRLNRDQPIERIEVIANKNEENPILFSVDEMVVTEGPRYDEE